jgi:hypothetical protein
MRWAAALSSVLLLPMLALATLGVFRGKLVEPPPQQDRAGWIFVQSPKGMLRQVEISKAQIIYGDDVPQAGRSESPKADLVPGAEVLVTAEQDNAGEWRATEVQILSLHAGQAGGRHPAGKLADSDK